MIDGPRGGEPSTVTGNSAAADLAAGTRLAGRFTIERRVGAGGMGVVYRARDESLGITVALKLLRPELASRPEAFERFRQELLLARQVSSPRVVRIHDIAEDSGRWFISMDFVEGQTLDRWLDGRGPIPVDQAVALVRQIAEGLQAAHARGIIHRDLKPSNILLDAGGEARIADFGVARSLGTTGLTHTGAIIGTPDYLSPEQARGAPVDARADLYALGLILYEMLAGEPAFAGTTPAESLARRLNSRPEDIEIRRPEVPRWLSRVMSVLLAPNPAHRFPDAAALIKALDEQRAPRPFPLALPAAGLALGVGLLAAYLTLGPEAPDAVPKGHPPLPERIAVIADPQSGAADPTLEAAAEILRLALAEHPALAVVDGERVAMARAQSTIDAEGTVSDAALSERLGRLRLVRLSRDAAADGSTAFEVTITTSDGEEPPTRLQGPRGGTAAAALRDAAPAVARALVLPPETATIPIRGDENLDAYGLALGQLWSGRVNDAADALSRLTAASPPHAPALAALADAARHAGRRAEALDALRRLADLPGRPFASRVAPWRAALEGDGDAVFALAPSGSAAMAGDPGRRLRLAELALEIGDLEAAREALDVVLANDPQDPRGWFLMGKTAILDGDARSAVEDHLVRALVLYKRARHRRGEAETVNALGVAYARLGQTDDAEEQYGRALSLRRDLGDARGVASSLRNLAQIDVFRGRHELAAQRLDEARRLFASLGDDAGVAAVENELGVLHEEQGDYAAALTAYRRGLRSRERGGDAPGVAESLNNIGFAHYQLGDYDNARALWRQAREAFAEMEDDTHVVRVDQNLGLLAIVRGDWRSARVVLDTSLREAEAQQMLEEAAVSLRNLVELDLLEGRLDDADRRLARTRGLFESREDQRGLHDADLLSVRLALARGDGAAAITVLDALAEGDGPASPEQATLAALLRVEAFTVLGRAEDALEAAGAAEGLADRAGIRALQLEARMRGAQTPDTALDDAIRQLGNVPLQLAWLERRATLQIETGALDEARDALREAESLLGSRQTYARSAALEALASRLRVASR